MSTTEPTATRTDSAAPLSAASAREAIGAANASFMEAFQAADTARLATMYTTSAQLLPPHSDVVAGPEAIGAFWKTMLAAGVAGVKLETTDLESEGDQAVEVGRYTVLGADGGALDSGKYLVVWRRDGGGWKLHRDIFNTSRPAPTA